MFSLNKILNFESRTKCSFKQYLHKEDFCFVLLLEARSELVVEDAMFILSYILSFWAIWDLISKQQTTEAQQKYTRAPLCTKKKPKQQKPTKKQRKSKPKLIVDEKGVILLFLELLLPTKIKTKTLNHFVGDYYEKWNTLFINKHTPITKTLTTIKDIRKARCGRTCL